MRMSMSKEFDRGTASMARRDISIRAALEWAFGVEKAQLELPEPEGVFREGYGFGLEYILMQRAALGCRIDAGRHKMGSYTHPDAEVVAAVTEKWKRLGLPG